MILLSSCSHQATDKEVVDVVNNVTRSLSVSVPAGDQLPTNMGVYINNTTYPAQNVENVLLTKKGIHYEAAQPLSWGGNDAKIGISAYSPYISGLTTDEISFSVKLNQQSKADYISSDLLWGGNSETVFGQGKLQLPLSHKMSKVVVEIKYAGVNVDPTNWNVENMRLFDFFTATSFFLKTGTCGPNYWQQDMIVPFGEGCNYEALVVPQSTQGFRHIEFNIRNKKTGAVKEFFSSTVGVGFEEGYMESGRAYQIIVEANVSDVFSTRYAAPTEAPCRVTSCHWNRTANQSNK